MKTALLSLMAFITLLMCSCHGGDKNILLRLKFNQGKKIDLKYRTYLVTENENDPPLINEYIRMSFKIESILPDSSYQLSGKIDFVRVKNERLLGSVEYTSDKYQGQMSSEELKLDEKYTPVIDSTYLFTIDKLGKIIKPFSFIDGRIIPKEYELVNLGIYQMAFPTEKIAIGDEWTTEQAIPGTKYKRTSTYHIESIYDNTIQIKVEGILDGPEDEAKRFSGRYFLDKNTCQLVSCEIERHGKTELADKGKMVISLEAK
jgi:hypothetical protein